MNTLNLSPRNIIILSLGLTFFLQACAGKKNKENQEPSLEQRVESLNSTVSRQMAKIEELDARLAATSDKLDATKISLDTFIENKSMKTQVIGEKEDTHSKTIAANKIKKDTHETNHEIPSIDDITQSFLNGMKSFKTGKYTNAVMEFNRFTEAYPEHILAGSAQYFIGESYFMMNEYKLASIEFEKVMSQFRHSPRVASAMVRLSQCQQKNGKSKEAEQTYALAEEIYSGNPSLDMRLSEAKMESVNIKKAEVSLPTTTIKQEASPSSHSIENKKDSLNVEPMTGNNSHEGETQEIH